MDQSSLVNLLDTKEFIKIFSGQSEFEESRLEFLKIVIQLITKKNCNSNEEGKKNDNIIRQIILKCFNLASTQAKWLCILVFFIFSELKKIMKSYFSKEDNFKHSPIWYICKNGFGKILHFLIFKNPFGFQDDIVKLIKENTELPSLLYMATYYQRHSIVTMLKEEPFQFDMNEKENGISYSILNDLRQNKPKSNTKALNSNVCIKNM